MDTTRNTPLPAPQFVVVAGFTALMALLLAWAVVSEIGTPSRRSISDPEVSSERDLHQLSPTNPDGLAIYRESERNPNTSASPQADGLKIYFASEREIEVEAPSLVAGLAIYRQSEVSSFSNGAATSNEEGLAIYRESEHAGAQTAEIGWDIYRSGELGR